MAASFYISDKLYLLDYTFNRTRQTAVCMGSLRIGVVKSAFLGCEGGFAALTP